MAEIEHFVKADAKQHPKFANVKDLRLQLYPRHHQVEVHKHLVCTLGHAVKEVELLAQLCMFKLTLNKGHHR
jgi:glycyl-tRNA synthetase (class II)